MQNEASLNFGLKLNSKTKHTA